jgi:serine/threonine protein kinase
VNLQAGAVVGNNIRLIRPLKRGGMGSVWVAEHQTLRMQVAVKFMAERLAEDREYVERFSREAMSSAQIKSPHVVQVFDHGVADGTPYIVMELLEGEDLRTRLARTGPITLREAAPVIVQLARALSKAHAAGIVHRDIKPDNIFLVEHDGEPFIKVLDFGVAKHTAEDTEFGMTGTGAMVGTPHYMSPEQILSARRVDHRADLWSAGVVMYRMLTGSVPFQGETLGAVCVAIERANFIPVSQRRSDVSPLIDAWFARALARDPQHRFQTAKEMAESFVVAADDGAYTAAAFRRPQMSLSDAPPGFGAVVAAPSPSNPWGTNPTNPGTPLGYAPPVSSPELSASRIPMPSMPPHSMPPQSMPPPQSVLPAWQVSNVAQQPLHQHQTFPGASVTHAERGGSSRRTVIAIVSAALGIMALVLVLAVVLVLRSGPTESAVASPQPPASALSTAVAAPVEAPTSAAGTASAAPAEVPSGSDATTSSKTPSVVKPNPTVKQRRDRGF